MKILFNVLQRTSTYFNVLQRTSTWLILCLTFALTSCKNDASVAPAVPIAAVPENLSDGELTEIKEYFDANKNVSSLNSNSPERNFQPRWDKFSVKNDRIEFDIFEDGKLPMTKLTSTGLKLGRMKYVYLRNAPDNAKRGLIVNFTPSEDFEGDVSKISTKNYRDLKFDGLIAFYELNGVVADAFKVVEGVATHKLNLIKKNQTTPRCGEVYVSTVSYYTMVSSPAYPQNGCTITYAGSGQSYSYGVPCIDNGWGNPGGGSGGSGSSAGYGNTSTYNAYLGVYNITPIQRLCPNSFVFQRVPGIVGQANARFEAGLKSDGFVFNGTNSDGNQYKVPFNHVRFGVPEFSPNFPNGIDTAGAQIAVTGALNQAVTNVQQNIVMNQLTPNQKANFEGYFWTTYKDNIMTRLGFPPNASSVPDFNWHIPSSAPNWYSDGQGGQLIIRFNVPITTNMANCIP
jgi:hypothetical protein